MTIIEINFIMKQYIVVLCSKYTIMYFIGEHYFLIYFYLMTFHSNSKDQGCSQGFNNGRGRGKLGQYDFINQNFDYVKILKSKKL